MLIVIIWKRLTERGYSKKLVHNEVLRLPIKTILDQEKVSKHHDRATFNTAYYPIFENRSILEDL